MTEAKLTWSIWQGLLKAFAWAFTRRGFHRFAEWMGGLLPSDQEWDVAAGRYEDEKKRGEGPFLGPEDKADVAIKRAQEGPMRVGEAKGGISLHKCRDMAGNGGAGHDMVGRERNGLDDAAALGEGEIDVAEIHQVHRRGGKVLDLHHHVEIRRARPQDDARRRQIMRAKAHRIFASAGDGDPGSLRIRSAGEAGAIHFRARHFAMQDMRIPGRRHAPDRRSRSRRSAGRSRSTWPGPAAGCLCTATAGRGAPPCSGGSRRT